MPFNTSEGFDDLEELTRPRFLISGIRSLKGIQHELEAKQKWLASQ